MAQKWPANEYTFKLYFFRRTPSHYFSFLFCTPIMTLTMTFLKTHPQPSRTSSDTRRWGSHSSIKSTLAVNRDNKGTTTGALWRMRARTRRPGSDMEDGGWFTWMIGWLDLRWFKESTKPAVAFRSSSYSSWSVSFLIRLRSCCSLPSPFSWVSMKLLLLSW